VPAPSRKTPIRPIGAHAPVAGGLGTASLKYAAAVRAEAIQIFVTNPRAWAASAGDREQARMLRHRVAATGLPVFIHAPYLINVGSPDPVVLDKSRALLMHCLKRGADLSARGVVVHAGSAITTDREAGLRRVRETLLPLLQALPGIEDEGPDLLIEPMAGQGATLCAAISEIEPYLAALDLHPRAKICIDTCHLFAAGHDLTAPDGVTAALTELAAVAPGRLQLIHANDSGDNCGSKKDRHRNIGQGMLKTGPFWQLLHHPATVGVPFVVETPGGQTGQARDVARLKLLRESTQAAGGAQRALAGSRPGAGST
jgi:deoxyribonuclease-4